jgi:plastocyanin
MQIVDNAFVDPGGGRNAAATVTVTAGQAVRWQNNGATQHTVTSVTLPAGATAFDSGDVQPGAVFDVVFTVIGTYTYRCENHPQEMLDATVIVQ